LSQSARYFVDFKGDRDSTPYVARLYHRGKHLIDSEAKSTAC